MKKSYESGSATHIGPESCGAARKGGVEALTGERAGPGIQPRKKLTPGRRRCKEKRKARSGAPISRGVPESREVRDPVHVRRTPRMGTGRSPSPPRARSCLGTRREV